MFNSFSPTHASVIYVQFPTGRSLRSLVSHRLHLPLCYRCLRCRTRTPFPFGKIPQVRPCGRTPVRSPPCSAPAVARAQAPLTFLGAGHPGHDLFSHLFIILLRIYTHIGTDFLQFLSLLDICTFYIKYLIIRFREPTSNECKIFGFSSTFQIKFPVVSSIIIH